MPINRRYKDSILQFNSPQNPRYMYSTKCLFEHVDCVGTLKMVRWRWLGLEGIVNVAFYAGFMQISDHLIGLLIVVPEFY